MVNTPVYIIDLNFRGLNKVIASYLIPHRDGVILVESGPATTLTSLQAGLKSYGYQTSDITDVLLTHIHLDHAGAAGWLARQGARIHVHPNSAPHLINPEKLLASARRIYGDWMETLWGEVLPVPEGRLSVLQHGEELQINGLSFMPVDTPGHASHHFAYLFEETLFPGDVAGVRQAGLSYVSLPMPPPDFHLEKWRKSLHRLLEELKDGKIRRIAPTHFGFYNDPRQQLQAALEGLDHVEAWIERVMPGNPTDQDLYNAFQGWTQDEFERHGISPDQAQLYESVNPAFMSVGGIQRYWNKYRQPEMNL